MNFQPAIRGSSSDIVQDLSQSIVALRVQEERPVAFSGGREFSEGAQAVLKVLATSQSVDKTVRSGWTLYITASTNPEYVEKVNEALDQLNVVLKNEEVDKMDTQMKDLFLARALQWTDEIMEANKLMGITDFENRNMHVLQQDLLSKGANREYFQLVSFFEGINPIAFAEGGPRFGYPGFNHFDGEKPITDTNGILQRIGGSWTLVSPSAKADQMEVVKELRKMVRALRNEKPDAVVHKLSHEQLLFAQVLLGQIMTNYLTNVDSAPPVSHQVFDMLGELYGLVTIHLEKRGEPTLSSTNLEYFKTIFGTLSNVLRQPRFQEFYSEGEKVALLEKADPILTDFITFHEDPDLMVMKNNLTTIAQDKKSGVNVYLTGKSGDDKRELVVFFNGHNDYLDRFCFDKFAFMGGRGTSFGRLEGMVHDQSLAEAEKARSTFYKILQAKKLEIGEFSGVKFVGYGLDGSTAQLIGFDYKKSNEEKEVFVIGSGVPPYLDETSAAQMGNEMERMSGFHCINYGMTGDPNMKNMGVTGPLGMSYDSSAFTAVPVPQGTIFAGEALKGDSRKAYMQMLGRAQKMHMAMREVYLQSQAMYGKLLGINPSALSSSSSSSSPSEALAITEE